MSKGQIIYTRNCMHVGYDQDVPVFVLSQNITQRHNRCIVLSDEKRISESGSYWTSNKALETSNGVLKIDWDSSVLGSDLTYPRNIFAHRAYLYRLHRNTPSEIKMYTLVPLAKKVKRGIFDEYVKQTF